MNMTNNPLSIRFSVPTLWMHGRGRVKDIGTILNDLKVKNALVITDRNLVDFGIIEPVLKALTDSKIEYSICDEVIREPSVDSFASLVNKVDLKKHDAFIAVGGGSVIDVSKGLRLIDQFGGSICDYAGSGKVPGNLSKPLIAIPTTAGTGSEVSSGAVFTDEKIKSKFALSDFKLCPTIALTDPEMTLTMPPRVTAITGIDALVHAIESYISRQANLVTEMFAERAIELIGANFYRVMKSGEDIEAREFMQIASTLATISGYNAKLGLCHAMAMPLCSLYDLPHGQATGVVLPYVLEFNSETVPKKIQRIFLSLGYIGKDKVEARPDKQSFIQLETLLKDTGLSIKLIEHGFKESHLEDITNGTLKSFQTSNNPRTVKKEDVVRIVQRLI